MYQQKKKNNHHAVHLILKHCNYTLYFNFKIAKKVITNTHCGLIEFPMPSDFSHQLGIQLCFFSANGILLHQPADNFFCLHPLCEDLVSKKATYFIYCEHGFPCNHPNGWPWLLNPPSSKVENFQNHSHFARNIPVISLGNAFFFFFINNNNSDLF